MSSSAERVESAGSLCTALLPEVDLGLRLETASDLEFASLALGSPKDVFEVLDDSSLSPGAVPKRRAEFAAGRHASALALSRFGCSEAVQREPSGAPRFPTGFVGSISHGAGVAVAVVARARDYRGLGIDVEEWISAAQAAEIIGQVLCAAELELLAQAFPHLSTASRLSLGFSIKESLYKCLNPIADEFIEFTDARLSRVEPRTATSGKIWLSLGRSFTGELEAGTEVPGCYVLGQARVETLAWLRWRRS
jgi:4'-phosphopantetheinyl transferase EntD